MKLSKRAHLLTEQECYDRANQYKLENPEQYAEDIRKINLGLSNSLPNGWKFLGKPSDGHYHNPELKWHAFTVGVPSNKFIVVVDEGGKHVGEVSFPEELP